MRIYKARNISSVRCSSSLLEQDLHSPFTIHHEQKTQNLEEFHSKSVDCYSDHASSTFPSSLHIKSFLPRRPPRRSRHLRLHIRQELEPRNHRRVSSPLHVSYISLKHSSDDGTPLTFTEFRSFLNKQREAISNRQLVSQSFVVAPADPLGWTGSVAYTHTFSGIEAGKEIVGTIVSIVKIEVRDGRRVVVSENFVMGT